MTRNMKRNVAMRATMLTAPNELNKQISFPALLSAYIHTRVCFCVRVYVCVRACV